MARRAVNPDRGPGLSAALPPVRRVALAVNPDPEGVKTMKNAVRTLLVAALAVPALVLAQVPSSPDLKAAGNQAAAAGAASGKSATDSAKAAGAATSASAKTQADSTGTQVKNTAKTEGKKASKKGVDAGAAKTGTVGATVAPHATGAANTGVDKGVDKAAEKAGIK